VQRIQANEPSFNPGERITLLDLEVLELGLVRVQGIWLERFHGTVITMNGIHFVEAVPNQQRSLALTGGGPNTVFNWGAPNHYGDVPIRGDAARVIVRTLPS
jgi:hypothetical protein